MPNRSPQAPTGAGPSSAPVKFLRFVSAPPLSEIKSWGLLNRRCRELGDNGCKSYVNVYSKPTTKNTSSTRTSSSLIAEEVCYVSEPEFVDSDGAIWGAMVTCILYIGDDGIDPFGYRIPGGGGGGGGLPLPCSVSGNFTINALVSGDPVLQSILAAVQAAYGNAVTFNFIPGASSNGTNAEAHYGTNTIDFYKIHSGADSAQILSHEGLHLVDEHKDPTTGIRPNPFPGEPGFQSTRVVTMTDGTQLTFNISVGPDNIMNAGYTAYEHYMIHDQMIRLYGEDLTSAMFQAFANADSVTLPGGTPQKMTPEQAKAAAATRGTTGSTTAVPAPPAPATLDNCSSTLSHARSVNSTRRTHGVDYIDGYYVNWDGEIAY